MGLSARTKLTSPFPINRLSGIIATFDTFDTNPSNPELMTDGNWATETGEGVETVTAATGLNRTIGRMFFDMGAIYPVILLSWINVHRASGDGDINAGWMWSVDGITWRYSSDLFTSGTATDYYRGCGAEQFYARYVGVRFTTSSVTIDPSVFHAKIAEIMAVQLL